MNSSTTHRFHIPVMGLAFTIDTPVKVAKFGISSVVSIIEDELLEKMREVISINESEPYSPISDNDINYRSQRISAYLNLMNKVIKRQIEEIRAEDFATDRQINQYFEMLPDDSDLKRKYRLMFLLEGDERILFENELKACIVAGKIDVNIMTKLDKVNYDKDGYALGVEYADAHSALRGFAESDLLSAIVFSAGMNPRLFAYCQTFNDFYPDNNGVLNKKIILKVSDYRSALIQGKFLAKKGLWVSEFRVESGINCGGHTFIADGVLLGPILEEFKEKREELKQELMAICNDALAAAGKHPFKGLPELRITVQGGIGTASENNFLLNHYQVDATGWGSPFLMVPEATNVDDRTLADLVKAKKEDYYLSHASPLGVPFNNFRNSTSEIQRKERIEKNRPGSPCYKKFLVLDTEFSVQPICTASRLYQDLKIKQLKTNVSDKEKLEKEIEIITEKDCLCEGLGAPALLKNNVKLSHNLKAVTICPGPNLAYFSGIFSLKQMVDHIYGRTDILNNLPRPHVFINELQLYIDHLKKETGKYYMAISAKEQSYLMKFKENLLKGIAYYNEIADTINARGSAAFEEMSEQLDELKETLYSAFFEGISEKMIV